MISIAAHYALGWLWLESILLGSIVGGSSSAIVFGLVRNVKISEETKSMLSFESALTDILATIMLHSFCLRQYLQEHLIYKYYKKPLGEQ